MHTLLFKQKKIPHSNAHHHSRKRQPDHNHADKKNQAQQYQHKINPSKHIRHFQRVRIEHVAILSAAVPADGVDHKKRDPEDRMDYRKTAEDEDDLFKGGELVPVDVAHTHSYTITI